MHNRSLEESILILDERRSIWRSKKIIRRLYQKWHCRIEGALVSGKILEGNTELEWESDMVNNDPYNSGWLTKLDASDLSELDSLLRSDSPDLSSFVIEEKKKFKK